MKKNIHNYIVLFFVLITAASWAQSGVIISLGPTIGASKSDGLTAFFNSYNDYFSDQLKTGFDESVIPLGFTALASFYTADGGLEGGIGYGQSWGSNKMTYLNDDKRVLKFSQSDYIVDLNFGTKTESAIYLHINLGTTYRSSQTQIFYQYNDGSKFYNRQRYEGGGYDELNGKYDSWRLSFYSGLSIGANLSEDGHRIYLRGDYYFKGGSFMHGIHWDNQSAKDNLTQQITNIPLDVNTYYTNSIDNIFNETELDTYGWRLTLAIAFPL